jgi:hypothetical protein
MMLARVAIVVVMAACVAVRPAAAQETLSDLGLTWEPMFTVADADALDRAAGLSAEQRSVVEDLMLAGMSRASVAVAEIQRDMEERRRAQMQEAREATGEDETPERAAARAAQEQERAMREHARFQQEVEKALVPIERQTLEDVRAVLTPGQIEKAWPIYERYRRGRVLPQIARVGMYGAVRSPATLLDGMSLTAEQLAAARAAVERHELGIEASRAFRKFWTENPAQASTFIYDYDASDDPDKPDGPARPEALVRFERAGRDIAAEYVRAARAMADALDGDARRALLHRRVESQSLEYHVMQSWGDRNSAIPHYLASIGSLTEEQRTRLKTLRREATRAIRDELIKDLEAQDQAVVRLEVWKPMPERVKAASAFAERVYEKLEKDALAVLSEEQRAEVDWRRPSAAKLRETFYQRPKPEDDEP